MRKKTCLAPTREDYRLADIISDRLRGMPLVERNRYFTDVVSTVLTEERYRQGEERMERFRAICSILGTRGGRKKPKTPRKAELIGKTGELFSGRKFPLPVAALARPYRGLWPEVRSDMTPEARELALWRRRQLMGEMLHLANLRRDDLLED